MCVWFKNNIVCKKVYGWFYTRNTLLKVRKSLMRFVQNSDIENVRVIPLMKWDVIAADSSLMAFQEPKD